MSWRQLGAVKPLLLQLVWKVQRKLYRTEEGGFTTCYVGSENIVILLSDSSCAYNKKWDCKNINQ